MRYKEFMKPNTDNEGSYYENSQMPVDGANAEPMTNEIFISPDVVPDGDSIYMKTNASDSTKDANTKNLNNQNIEFEYGSTGANDESSATNEAMFLENGYIEDYGQRLADMNVDGMPWFDELPDQEELLSRLSEPQLNARETRKLIFSSLFAALAVAGVFVLALFLFLMFCIHVWF